MNFLQTKMFFFLPCKYSSLSTLLACLCGVDREPRVPSDEKQSEF